MSAGLRASVVVPNFDGAQRVRRLLDCLAVQTLSPRAFEVIIVDDGSPAPLHGRLGVDGYPFAVTIVRQENAGAAAARHNGALHARADTLVFVDDDMVVPPEFLQAHLQHHEAGDQVVVLGRMRGHAGDWGLMERWHQVHLDRHAAKLSRDARAIRGNHMFSGNVSMRRRDYLAAGGFDAGLRRGHDAELGLRLEKCGARFVFSEAPWSEHGSDKHDLGWWRDRAALYGRVDRRISKKHPDLPHASPWRWLREMNPVARPFILLAVRRPEVASWISLGILRAAEALEAVKLERVSMKAVSLAYTIDYFRGVRAEIGSTEAALAEGRAWVAQHAQLERVGA